MTGKGDAVNAIARRSTRAATVFVLALFAVVGQAWPGQAQPYSIVPIDAPPDYGNVFPTDLNNRLQVVGYAFGSAGRTRHFIWDPVGGFRLLPAFSDGSWWIWIDDNGVVYGKRDAAGTTEFIRLVGNTAQPLPQPPGDTITSITHVTNNGIVLMRGERSWGLVGETLYDLQALTGASIAAVNEQGMLGGCANGLPYVRYADGRVLQPWDDSRCVEVMGPDGHVATSQQSTANPSFASNRAFYARPDGRLFTVASVSPPFFRASGLNRSGTLVGWFQSSLGGDERPVIFTANGELFDLNGLLISSSWRARVATAINDAGYIVASNGSSAALLVPTAPLSPAGVTFEVRGGTVILRWEPSPAVADYVVEAGRTPGGVDFFAGSVGKVTAVSAAVPSGRYYVRVRGRTAAGLLTSPSQELVIDVAAASAPAAPTRLRVVATKIVGVLEWDASADATEYIVEAGTAPGATNAYNASVGSDRSLIVVSPPPGRYYVRVRARNSGGISAPSEEIVIDVH
jgi:hypothetical protein